MKVSTRPVVLPVALVATLLLGGCAEDPAADPPVAAESEETEETAPEPAPDDDPDAASEAASEPEPQQQAPPTAEFVSTPPDNEVAMAVVDQCSRPSGELSLDFSGQRTDGIVIEIEATDGTGTAEASTPGLGDVIAEESGPAQLSQQADGSLLVAWGEYELAIHNC